MGCSGSSATRVIIPFIWGHTGSVLIKSAKLVLAWDPSGNRINIKVNNDKVVESLLTWNNRRFYLEDLFITDLNLRKKFKCPGIKACFTVSDYDQFQDMQEKEIFLNKVKEVSGKNLDRLKSNVLLSSIKNDCKDLWEFTRNFWIKHKNQSERTEIVHFGRDCFQSTIEIKSSPSKIQEFLEKKYKASNFVKLKKDIKAKVIMEKENNRPHVVKLRKSFLVNFFVENQHQLEIQEEVKVFIFCWDDVPELAENEFLDAELRKMQSGAKLVYSELQQEIDNFMIKD